MGRKVLLKGLEPFCLGLEEKFEVATFCCGLADEAHQHSIDLR